MVEIVGDLELRNVLADPLELYRVVTSKERYRQQPPRVEGDCELILTDLVAKECLVVVTVSHSRREAFLSLISTEDALLMAARLGDLVPELTAVRLRESMRRRPRV